MDGEKDNTVPWAVANASYKWRRRNDGVTEIVQVAGRGRALTIDHGWRESRRHCPRVRTSFVKP